MFTRPPPPPILIHLLTHKYELHATHQLTCMEGLLSFFTENHGISGEYPYSHYHYSPIDNRIYDNYVDEPSHSCLKTFVLCLCRVGVA